MRDGTRSVGSMMGGLFLIGLGLLFLLGQLLNADIWHYVWPLFIMSIGMVFFGAMVAGGRDSDSGALAIPGSLLTVLGLIFIYQNIFGHWSSWAYVWTLLAPTSIGIGLSIFGLWNRRPQLYQPGMILIALGLALFVVFGGFFEFMFGFIGFATHARLFWPALLILIGLALLFGNVLRWVISTSSSTVTTVQEHTSRMT